MHDRERRVLDDVCCECGGYFEARGACAACPIWQHKLQDLLQKDRKPTMRKVER